MTRKFYNQANDVQVIIHDNDEGATTAILGDESKVTDDEILALYNGEKVDGWIDEDAQLQEMIDQQTQEGIERASGLS